MSAVTQIIPSYLGGVSRQTDEKKRPGQVKECLNAYPDPTFGLRKRPGLKFIKTLQESSDPSSPDFADAKWFFIKRDNEEKYMGCILDKDIHSSDPIKIWNTDGTACTVTYPDGVTYLDTTRDNYDILTVQDNSVITNKTKTVTAQAATSYVLGSKGTIRLLLVKYSCVYSASLIVDGTTHNVSFTTISAEASPPAGPGGSLINTAATILAGLKTALDALSLPGTLTVTQLESTLELSYVNASANPEEIKLTVTDDLGNVAIRAYTKKVNVISDLAADSVEGRIVEIINSTDGTAQDNYWSIFVAENGVSGVGYWKESLDPTVSPGMNASTLPHQLRNTALNTFVFEEADWSNRKVGDLETNKDPSFSGYTIQQAFFHNNRLGILSEDNVILSRSGDFYNFYATTALTSTSADPIDINCSSIRPAVLHAIIPTAQGLILFSKSQQFILFSDAEILTPASAVIRGISNYEMDANIDPVDVGTHINFVSKTPSYSRVFGMQTRGSEESPIVNDISKVVSEWIPNTVTAVLSSPQNFMIGLYGPLDNTLYLHKTYVVGEEAQMQAWVKWDLPGNIQHAAIDSDTMWTVVEYNGKYVLASASISQTPEEKIIINSEGQQVNPHMDLYGAVSSMTYDSTNNLTKCYLPTGCKDNADLTPVLVIAGNGTTNFAGVTESGFTINPTRPTGQTHATAAPYFEVPNKDISNLTALDTIDTISTADASRTAGTYTIGASDYTTDGDGSGATFSIVIDGSGAATVTITAAGDGYAIDETFTITDDKLGSGGGASLTFDVATITSDVIVGYTYNYDVELPKTYFKLNPEGTIKDYSASLTIARMKFAVGLSSVVEFKVKSKGYRGELAEFTGDGSTTDFSVPFPLKEENGIVVKLDGAKQASSTYSVTTTDAQATVTFNTAPTAASTAANVTTPAQKIEITTDTWYDVQPVQDANQYLADDVPLLEETIFTIPIHQRTNNFNIKVFSKSPFPVSLSSMMWEGNYSPKSYRRT